MKKLIKKLLNTKVGYILAITASIEILRNIKNELPDGYTKDVITDVVLHLITKRAKIELGEETIKTLHLDQ